MRRRGFDQRETILYPVCSSQHRRRVQHRRVQAADGKNSSDPCTLAIPEASHRERRSLSLRESSKAFQERRNSRLGRKGCECCTESETQRPQGGVIRRRLGREV